MLPPDRPDPAADAAPRRAHERLLVRVGAERFALPTASVLEAVDAPALHDLPGLPAGCLGLLSWRGRRLPVRCPGTVLGQRAAHPAAAVLVLAAASDIVAVAVDELLDVRDLPPERLRPLPGLRDPFRVVRGVVVNGEEIVADLVPEALAAAAVEPEAAV